MSDINNFKRLFHPNRFSMKGKKKKLASPHASPVQVVKYLNRKVLALFKGFAAKSSVIPPQKNPLNETRIYHEEKRNK